MSGTDNAVTRFGIPHGDGIPDVVVLVFDSLLLYRQAQKNFELMRLKSSVRLELSLSRVTAHVKRSRDGTGLLSRSPLGAKNRVNSTGTPTSDAGPVIGFRR